MISLQFLVTALVVVIAPGTGVLYTLALGLGQGVFEGKSVDSVGQALVCCRVAGSAKAKKAKSSVSTVQVQKKQSLRKAYTLRAAQTSAHAALRRARLPLRGRGQRTRHLPEIHSDRRSHSWPDPRSR